MPNLASLENNMQMENFSPESQTPEPYIIDITYKIWEERGVVLNYM